MNFAVSDTKWIKAKDNIPVIINFNIFIKFYGFRLSKIYFNTTPRPTVFVYMRVFAKINLDANCNFFYRLSRENVDFYCNLTTQFNFLLF